MGYAPHPKDGTGRVYDFNTHTFLQRDPTGEAGGVNLYEGFRNDPVNWDDPTGDEPVQVQPTTRPAAPETQPAGVQIPAPPATQPAAPLRPTTQQAEKTFFDVFGNVKGKVAIDPGLILSGHAQEAALPDEIILPQGLVVAIDVSREESNSTQNEFGGAVGKDGNGQYWVHAPIEGGPHSIRTQGTLQGDDFVGDYHVHPTQWSPPSFSPDDVASFFFSGRLMIVTDVKNAEIRLVVKTADTPPRIQSENINTIDYPRFALEGDPTGSDKALARLAAQWHLGFYISHGYGQPLKRVK